MRALAAGLLTAAAPGVADAHSVVERYNPYYIAGAVAVVVLSFAAVGFFVKRPPRLPAADAPAADEALPAPAGGAVRGATSVLALALLVVVAGAGSQIESWNLAPVFLLAIAWSVLPALQVIAGDVWTAINPWRAGFELLERWRRRPSRPRLRYPAALGRWPAVVGLFVVLLVLLHADDGWSPRLIGTALLAYTLLTWIGMSLFGKEIWLARGEVVTVAYGLFASLRLGGRPWAARLYAGPVGGFDTVALVLLLLAGGMARAVVESRPWASLWLRLGGAADSSLAGPVAFLTLVGLVVASYAALCFTMAAVTGADGRAGDMARGFAASLLPVVAVFHFASVLPHVAEDLQLLLRLASDPLGLGWNLLATRTLPILRPPVAVVWHAQVATLVLAHVAALYVAHLRALVVYGRTRVAMVSQVPMLALMVLYTVSGLWVLSTIPLVMPDDVLAPAHWPAP